MPHFSFLTLSEMQSVFAGAADCAIQQLAQTNAGLQQALNLPLLGMQIIITVWVFTLGTCFGSFLNVVIYRLPAGMSLGRPKSRCPRCETPLAARDNIPVLGWLLLRGKCRYCGLPIAARYPLIEAACGFVFLILLFGELLRGGANLPLRQPDHFHVNSGFWLVWFMKWDLSGLYLYHCFLTVAVLAVCMIGYDGHRPVGRLRWFGILVGLVCGTMWLELRPVPAYPYLPHLMGFVDLQWGFHWIDPLISPGAVYWTGVTLPGLLDGLAGLAAGAFVGWLILWQMRSNADAAARPSLLAVRDSFMLTGTFLGWQAVGTLAVVVMPLLLVVKVAGERTADDGPPRMIAPLFFGLLLAFIPSWQYLHAADWMIGIFGWSFTDWGWRLDWATAFGVLVVVAAVGRFALDGVDPSMVSD